jgi:hypothetical protein
MDETMAPAEEAFEHYPPRLGLWECLNTGNCKLAAPDPRNPATLFEGPTQLGARELPAPGVVCPECGGIKVIYRGEKNDAAASA